LEILEQGKKQSNRLGGGLKGTVARDGFLAHCILLMIERKDLKFFHVVLISTGLGQDLTHLAHKENTHSIIFLFGRLKILITICSLTALIQYMMPSHVVEMLTL
jgi:hypothetical protein